MAAAIRSRRPQLPCPVMLDQTHNAQLVKSLQCTSNCIPYSKLNLNNLSEHLKLILDPIKGEVYRENAIKYGDVVNNESENALDKYCTLIETYNIDWTKV